MNAPANETLTIGRREVLLLVVLSLAIFATRLPWISVGFGSDPDAYRVANVSRELSRTGVYNASRLPGYPAYEYLVAFTHAWNSPRLSNGLTAIASCVAGVFFALILRHFRIQRPWLLAMGYAMTPVIYVNSVNTMDYMFAAALALGSTYFVLIHRPIVAGILLGLAIGCRITSGIMLAPLVFWMLMEERSRPSTRRTLSFIASSILVGIVCFAPVAHRYGREMFAIPEYRGPFSWDALYWKWVLGVWGELAAIGLVVLACLTMPVAPEIRANVAIEKVRRGLALSLITVGLYVAAFLWLPLEAAYLIPIVPFALLSMGLLWPTRFVTLFAALLLFSSFFSIGNQMGVRLAGPIIMDRWTRERRVDEIQDVIQHVARLADPAVIVVGWNLPQIMATAGDELRVRHEFVYLVEDEATFHRYAAQDRAVYFLRYVNDFNLEARGVDLKRLGAKPLGNFDEP